MLRAPHAARAFVAETLKAWDIQAEEVDAAQLVVSELVTNAVATPRRVRRSPCTYA